MRAPVSRLVIPLVLASASSSGAYPEFQQYINKHSGRSVDCALCHTNAAGPEGTAPGQIGKLNQTELSELGRARAAFAPGGNVNSPILNAFGNHIINSIGKTRFLELRLKPEELAAALPQESDMDHDGIPDPVELTDGTHPLLKSDGLPHRLFKANFAANLGQIALMLGATILGLWGLKHLLSGFATATTPADESHGKH